MGFLKDKSAYAGTCKMHAEHTWKVNDPIYMQKKPDGGWLMCNNKDCFIAQGGTVDEKATGGKGRSIEMSLSFAKAFDDWAWKLAMVHAEEITKELTNGEKVKQKGIATESIYHTLVEAFNGK